MDVEARESQTLVNNSTNSARTASFNTLELALEKRDLSKPLRRRTTKAPGGKADPKSLATL